MQELISVIVPIFGIERYVGQCIESILNQTYRNLEIILVDDGSTDRCPEICDLYAGKDDRIKVIHKENGGLVSARKAGVEAANGDFVGYVDGDDWIEPTYYENMLNEILDANADMAVAGFSRDLFDNATKIYNNIKSGTYEGESLQFLKKNMMSYGAFYKNGISTYVWNKLFKRDIIKKYQALVDNAITIGEDAAVVYPLITECERIVVSDNTDYHYRQREDSMLKKSKPFSEEKCGLRILYKYLTDYFLNDDCGYDYLKQVKDFILGICIIRSGGLAIKDDILLPFEYDFKGKKVVVYSAGTFGQQLVYRISEHDYCDIVSWLDDDYWEYRRCCLNVDPVESIKEIEFDVVLIATLDSDLSEMIRKRLINLNVDSNKILMVRCREDSRAGLIEKYLQ